MTCALACLLPKNLGLAWVNRLLLLEPPRPVTTNPWEVEMMSFTHTRPHPPTDERLPRWKSNLLIIGADLVLWAAIICVALILWRALP